MSAALLISEPPLQVLPALAVKVGLNEAIVLQQVHYWALKAKPDANGHRWVYNTIEAWAAQFPFWSLSTIKRTVHALRAEGYLVAEKLSKNAMDQTLHYRIDHQKLGSVIGSSCAAPSVQSEPMTRFNLNQCLDKTETTKRSRAPRSLLSWLEEIKQANETAIPADDPVFVYASNVGIPDDFLRLCWLEFRDRHSEPDAKRYTNWRAAFRNCVRSNWYGLWFSRGNGYELTTRGHQAQRAHQPQQVAA